MKANIQNPDDAQIAAWKEEYKNIYEITSEDGTKRCILKKPGRKELSFASSAGETDPFKFNESLMKSCWLGGDLEMQTDDDLFLSASKQLGEIVKAQNATLKKL